SETDLLVALWRQALSGVLTSRLDHAWGKVGADRAVDLGPFLSEDVDQLDKIHAAAAAVLEDAERLPAWTLGHERLTHFVVNRPVDMSQRVRDPRARGIAEIFGDHVVTGIFVEKDVDKDRSSGHLRSLFCEVHPVRDQP